MTTLDLRKEASKNPLVLPDLGALSESDLMHSPVRHVRHLFSVLICLSSLLGTQTACDNVSKEECAQLIEKEGLWKLSVSGMAIPDSSSTSKTCPQVADSVFPASSPFIAGWSCGAGCECSAVTSFRDGGETKICGGSFDRTCSGYPTTTCTFDFQNDNDHAVGSCELTVTNGMIDGGQPLYCVYEMTATRQ